MTRSSPQRTPGRSTLTRLQSEQGIIWWVILIIAVVVVAIVATAAGVYLSTKGSGTVTNPMPKVCGGGGVDVKAHLRGAGANQSYEITVTATRRCELGQNCMCAGTSGTFGTPTTPCDQYDGSVGPITFTDTVVASGTILTEYTKPLDNLKEGIWEVQISVKVQGSTTAAVVKTCCVIVKSGQRSTLEYWCQRVLLPGTTCPDCTSNTAPGPTGGPSTTTPP